MKTLKIASLSKKVSDCYFSFELPGSESIRKFRDELENCDPIELIAYQVMHHEPQYSFDFFLNLPSLWRTFDLHSWCKLFRTITPREFDYKMPSESGWYADIQFFFRFLKLNILPVYCALPSVDIDDKLLVLIYCKQAADSLVPDPIDFEDLADDTLSCLAVMRDALMAEGVSASSGTEEEAIQTSHELMRQLGFNPEDWLEQLKRIRKKPRKDIELPRFSIERDKP